MDYFSVKGAYNLAMFIESLSDKDIQFHIFIDDYQSQKEPSERWYSIKVLEEEEYIASWDDENNE